MYGLVAAGGVANAELRARGIERVPMLTVGGEPLLSRTCRQLLRGGCSSVLVLAPAEVDVPDSPGIRRAQYTQALIDDLLHCVAADVDDEFLLLCGSDMPLLSSEAVAAVVEAGQRSQADVVFPIVDRATMEARFAGSHRTYLRLRDGVYTAGNIIWVNREWLLGQGDLIRELFEQRKNVVALARRFGLAFCLRVMVGWANLRYLERHIGRIVNGELHAAIVPYPEIAADLDKAADLETFAGSLDQW